jgi:hypothetical protein
MEKIHQERDILLVPVNAMNTLAVYREMEGLKGIRYRWDLE